MNELQAAQAFKDEIEKKEKEAGRINYDVRRQHWINFLEAMQKDGTITMEQALHWRMPDFCHELPIKAWVAERLSQFQYGVKQEQEQ